MTIQETDPEGRGLCLDESNDNPILLSQKDVKESHKTLGVFKNVYENNKDQFSYVKKKCEDMADRIRRSEWTRSQAQRAYSSCVLPAVGYSLPAVDLTKKQHEELQKIIIALVTQKCGYEMCYPRSVVYGPTQYGGLNMPHIHVETNGNK
jgi:hypothetical protein